MNKTGNMESKTKKQVYIALLIAVELVLAMTPLGFIPVGVIRATTIHIPVIIGAIIFGPAAGALLGAVFGITSILINTFQPSITSFVFSPFYGVGEFHGNLWSLVIAMVPRMLIGVTAYYAFKWARRLDKKRVTCFITAGLVGSLTNTILVMSGIYIFFGQSYALAKDIPYETLFTVIIGIIGTNGVIEAIVAAILTLLVAKPLIAITKVNVAGFKQTVKEH